jgi:hypothetical protein
MCDSRAFDPSIPLQSAKQLYRCAAVFTLLCGVAVYTFFREVSNFVLFCFFPKPGFLNGLPLHIDNGNFAVSFFIFHCPDILWLLSGIFFIRSVWLADKKWMQIYIFVFSLAAVANELSQIPAGIPGTFDVFDLLSLCVTAFMESVLYHLFIHRRIK